MRFRIAFSFAGEKRIFVSKVADILAQRFGEEAVLYDKYHEAEFARRDLGVYLPDLYHDQSDLVVVVVCPDYDEKEWTGLEWMAIHDLLKKRRNEEVMLCRYSRATVKGVHTNAGWMDLDCKTPEQAAGLILERLALNEGKSKNHYTAGPNLLPPSPRTSIPNNLPRLQPFFGRKKELAAIREALDHENRTWGTLIDGPGGMGKTSLAIRAAYDCQPGQFHRIIFLSVKDREMDDDGERKLTGFILPGFLDMLNELARELKQPDILKAAEHLRIGLLLDALRPARALLIFDNLESLSKLDRDQIFTLIKRLPQGCKAILTSRRRLGAGSEELILDKLDQDAAMAILADLACHNKLLAKTSEADRIALYRHTGGKPLLLRWAAGQLGRGSCRTVTDALHFLGICPPENDPLEFVFGDLLEEFSLEETRVLCALTYFTLMAKSDHVAEVAGLDKGSVETALRSLANRSLVVPDQEEEAFSLVPMVAEFLQRKRPEVITETGSHLEKWAYAIIVENGYEEHNRFPVLDAAWPTLEPALPLFLAASNDRLQTVCDALNTFLEFTGRWDEWLALSQQSEAKATVAGDYANAGWRAYHAGWVYHLRQQAEAVLDCAKRAERHWNEAKAGVREQALAIRLQGIGHHLKEDYAAAIATYRQTLDLLYSLSAESKDVTLALNALANAEKHTGDFAAAERDYRESLRIALAIGYVEGVSSVTGNLAGLAINREDWPAAEALARDALSVSEQMGRQEAIGKDCWFLAQALAWQGRKTEGLTYARRAVEIFTRLRLPAHREGASETLRICET